MKEIVADKSLIAYCGLYCGACKKHLSGKCPGCQKNVKASWCKVRTCCMSHSFASCAECRLVPPSLCEKLNNFIAKIFAFVFRTDRPASINFIRKNGYALYASEMTERKQMAFKR